MNTVDPHSILHSVKESLLNRQELVDGRTESDWLNFIANFSSLINFYDQQNRLRGNWEPFVLKDPVILLASISKTACKANHTAFKKVCANIEKLVQDGKSSQATDLLNHLFDTLINVFQVIRRWVYYMQLSDEEYPLKTFTLRQVTNTFSRYFWAIISLRQNLFLIGLSEGLKPVNNDELYLFDAVDGLVWKQNKDKEPCWDVLGLAYPLNENKIDDITKALANAGMELFRFQSAIINHAPAEMEEMKKRRSRFPDTLLLRSFADMLGLYKEQFNTITEKHLRFCYKDILKLKERTIQSDSVFLCTDATSKERTFTLPAGTPLDAGIDAQNKPVTFTTLKPVQVNPATIPNAITIAALKGSDNRYRIYKTTVAAPGTVLKDDNGNLKTWSLFGENNGATSVVVKQAVAFASPLLLLREGDRTITFTINFSKAPPGCLDDTQYYLSTKSAWYPVKPGILNIVQDTDKLNSITLQFVLPADAPPIEAFVKNASGKDPDGLQSEWPLLKAEFTSVPGYSSAPEISSLKIETRVRGIKTIQLYNDYGPLSSKAPFQPFGPTPLHNSHFIIGSDEIFSKPPDMIQLQLNWDKTPGDLEAYYKQYNEYLAHKLEPDPLPKKETWLEKIFSTAWKGIKRFFNWIAHLFCKKREKELPDCPPFCNTGFRVDFTTTDNGAWTGLDMFTVNDFGKGDGDLSWSPYKEASCSCKSSYTSPLLFSTTDTDKEKCQVAPATFYVYDKKSGKTVINPDPYIQQKAFGYTGKEDPGFFRLSLAAPEHGFGSGIYAEVVTAIANQNAWILYNSQPKKDFFGFTEKQAKPVFIEAAKQPFAPKLTGVAVNYSASVEYKFPDSKKNYPLQCFFYTPFSNYCIYDTNADIKPGSYSTELIDLTETIPGDNGMPLYQSLNQQGYLFLETGNLVAPSALNLFFELAQKNQLETNTPVPSFRYLSSNGWKAIDLLDDSTNKLACSGIITLNVPPDISNDNPVMPLANYWFAIAVNDTPANYAQAVFLKTNGFIAARMLPPSDTGTAAPVLAAGAITKPKTAIPQITELIQPFPSFGGKAAESETEMQLRVANRLAIKDRAVTAGDFFLLVKEQFNGIYHTKAVYLKKEKQIAVYVVRQCNDKKGAHAFLPFVSNCMISSISQYLRQRAPGSVPVTVSNFRFQYIKVCAGIETSPGFSFPGVQRDVNNALNLYFSPWISGNDRCCQVGMPVGVPEIAAFIKDIPGVAAVKNISFQSWKYADGDDPGKALAITSHTIAPIGDDYLIVPSLKHHISELT